VEFFHGWIRLNRNTISCQPMIPARANAQMEFAFPAGWAKGEAL